MKVVHVFWGLSFGGIETMLVNIVNEQVNLGVGVDIIIVNDIVEKSLLKGFCPEVKVYCLNRKRNSRNLTFILRLNSLLNRINPDAIHLHGSRFYKMILNKKLRRKTSLTLHDLPMGEVRRENWLYRLLPVLNIRETNGNVTFIDEIPRVFAISQAVRDKLLSKYGVGSVVVNNGIKTSSFRQRTKENVGELFKMIQVSRLTHDKKGQDLLIDAVAALCGKVDVTFVGEGGSLDFLMKLAKEKGVEKYVHFEGKKEQSYIAEHLCDYDLFVQPSRYEGFGLTVAEAMAAKVPVLVSSGQGPAEVTCNDKYGWVFENGDVEDLVKKISFIISHYDIALAKAETGCQHVVNTYDVSVTAQRYLDLY